MSDRDQDRWGDGRRLGPAARARAEGRPYGTKLVRSSMTPRVNDDGTPRSALPLPYRPVLSPCSLCPARCCRLSVRVSLIDAVVYCHTLDLPFFAGLTLGASDHATHAFPVADDPRIQRPDARWTGRAEIFLRRRPDGTCAGLIELGGFERCGVYGARPSVCRIYPFTWTSDVARGGPGAVCCPVPYGVTEAEERRALQDIEHSIETWEQHDDLVAEWSEAVAPEARTVEAFLAFALPRAAALAGLPAPRFESGETPASALEAALRASGVKKF